MKTKYVCRGFISLCVNFHNNRTMWSTNLVTKFSQQNLQVGERKKSPAPWLHYLSNFSKLKIKAGGLKKRLLCTTRTLPPPHYEAKLCTEKAHIFCVGMLLDCIDKL